MAASTIALLALTTISVVAGTTTGIISAENTKKGAEIQAQGEEDAMAAENAKRAQQLRVAQATGRSLAAAGGIDPFSGSPLAVQESNQRQYEIETGFGQRNRRVRAALLREQGRNSETVGILGAIGTVTEGGARLYSQGKALGAWGQ